MNNELMSIISSIIGSDFMLTKNLLCMEISTKLVLCEEVNCGNCPMFTWEHEGDSYLNTLIDIQGKFNE